MFVFSSILFSCRKKYDCDCTSYRVLPPDSYTYSVKAYKREKAKIECEDPHAARAGISCVLR